MSQNDILLLLAPGDNFGKEVIMKYRSTPLVKNNQSFWTDSNGRQMMHRKKNHRFSFEFRQQDIEEPVASNYYPVTTGRSQKFVGGS